MNNDSLFWSRVVGPTLARYGWYLFVLPILLANIFAFRAITQPRAYTSVVRFNVGSTPTDFALGLGNISESLLINRELRVALSSETKRRVTFPPGGASLSGSVSTTTNEIILSATASTPTGAQVAADSFGDAYLAESVARRSAAYKRAEVFVERSLATAQNQLASAKEGEVDFYRVRVSDLRNRLLNIRELSSKTATTTVELNERASVPFAPTNRPPLIAAVLGAIFGIGLSGVVVLFLDFGEKQRVSLDDIRAAQDGLRVLGVTPYRRLRKAALVGSTVKAALERSEAEVVCLAFVGSRLKARRVTSAMTSALDLAGIRAAQVGLSTAATDVRPVEVQFAVNEWTLLVRDPSFVEEAGQHLRKAMADTGTAVTVVRGPQIRNSTESGMGVEVADEVILVVDALSTTNEGLTEALINLENLDRKPIGVLFFPR